MKFRSHVLTALNSLPSIATLASLNSSRRRHSTTNSRQTFGATAVLDLMFWTSANYGWFVKPSYSYGFSHGHEQNLAVNVGLLIALPPH
jgi:hypothetical protein